MWKVSGFDEVYDISTDDRVPKRITDKTAIDKTNEWACATSRLLVTGKTAVLTIDTISSAEAYDVARNPSGQSSIAGVPSDGAGAAGDEYQTLFVVE